MLSNSGTSIEFNDTLAAPTVFDAKDSSFVVGDSEGHLSILKSNFSDVDKYIGIPLEAATTTKTYPLHFGSIKAITINNANDVIFIASNKVYKTNLLAIANDEKIYKVTSLPATIRITELVGLDGYTIHVSVDGIAYKSLEYYMTHDIAIGSSIYVRLTNARQTVQALTPSPSKGVIILKIV